MIIYIICLVFVACFAAGAFAGRNGRWLRRIAIGTGIIAAVLGWAIIAVGCGPFYLLQLYDMGRCEDGLVVLVMAAVLVMIVLSAAGLGLLFGWLSKKVSP